MQDISILSKSDKEEIAKYIREDTLDIVNKNISAGQVRNSFYTKYGKRFIDIVLSLLAVVITFPINLIIAIITYFDVGRPIIFKQSRIGRDEKTFYIYKFRNMTNAVDSKGELLPSSKRVTKWGKFVRKTSLDELLNFVSILKGDMSLIGPRPLLDYYSERLNDYHKTIYKVRPGLECPPMYKVDHTLSWQERLDNYVWYAENCSLWVDIRLCFRIFKMVFDKKSTEQRASADHGAFMGYDRTGNAIYSKRVPDEYVDMFCKKHNYQDLQDLIKAKK